MREHLCAKAVPGKTGISALRGFIVGHVSDICFCRALQLHKVRVGTGLCMA